jgi:branched-chain amino acid transport system ATP-binding protein
VHYGGIRAVKGIDLEVAEGELVSLIGANGAGKTEHAQGDLPPDRLASESAFLLGRGHLPFASHELPRKGLVMVPEGRGIFPQLTVEENLAMGAYARGGGDCEKQYATFPRLKERRLQVAGTLSGGEQQMLAIARRADGRARSSAAGRAVDGSRADDGGAHLRGGARDSPRAASPSCWSSRTRGSRSSSRIAAT